MKVAVLGGGVTGIGVARTLVERGYDPHVFEAGARIGGLCRSEVHDGYVHDLSGGHVLHSRDRSILADMVGWLGDDGAVETVRNTKIYYRGRYVKYPFENGLADLPVEDRFACVKGYIDAYLARRQGISDPRNFREWIQWRLGAGIGEHFMYPYNEKIWCSDLTDVATDWIAGRVPEAPYDDVLRSALGIETEGYTHQSKFYYPRTGGFETLVQRLADPVRERVRLETLVTEVVADHGRFEVNGEPFDAVVNSIPIQELYRALRPAPPDDVQSAVDGLKFLSIATVLLGVDQEKLSPYSWVYLPHAEAGPVNRLTFLSNYSPDNAPPGKSSILAEVTFPGGREQAGESIEKEVADSLARCGFYDPAKLELVRSHALRYAYPYYDVDFEPRMATIRHHLSERGLESLGRFGDYRYVNTDQIMISLREFFVDAFPPLT